MLKVYIGSSARYIEQCKHLAGILELKYCAQVTRKWWLHYVKDKPDYEGLTDAQFYTDPKVRAICRLDKQAIREADIIIIVNPDGSKLTGATYELAYAEALDKLTVVYGKMKQSAMFSDTIMVSTYPMLFAVIEPMLEPKQIEMYKYLRNREYGQTAEGMRRE